MIGKKLPYSSNQERSSQFRGSTTSNKEYFKILKHTPHHSGLSKFPGSTAGNKEYFKIFPY